MTHEENLQHSLRSLQTDGVFSEAVAELGDGSRLCFCHRVGERWAKAVGPASREEDGGLASELLAAMTMFRLNAKHLEIHFDDGSRWENVFAPPRARGNPGP
jgi:hypothetical protein